MINIACALAHEPFLADIAHVLHSAFRRIEKLYYHHVVAADLRQACADKNQEDVRAWLMVVYVILFRSYVDYVSITTP